MVLCHVCRIVYSLLIQERTVYLCATSAADTKQRVCFAFLMALQEEYERAAYSDQQDLSKFQKFIREQMVHSPIFPSFL